MELRKKEENSIKTHFFSFFLILCIIIYYSCKFHSCYFHTCNFDSCLQSIITLEIIDMILINFGWNKLCNSKHFHCVGVSLFVVVIIFIFLLSNYYTRPLTGVNIWCKIFCNRIMHPLTIVQIIYYFLIIIIISWSMSTNSFVS